MNNKQICFTGFPEAQKPNLRDLAKSHGFDVVKSVTKSLDYLCLGMRPGTKKIQKACRQGTQIIDYPQWVGLVKTGVMPEMEL